MPAPKIGVGSSDALTPQLPDTLEETKERTKKHWNHKHVHGGYLELKSQIVSIKTKQYHLYHHQTLV